MQGGSRTFAVGRICYRHKDVLLRSRHCLGACEVLVLELEAAASIYSTSTCRFTCRCVSVALACLLLDRVENASL